MMSLINKNKTESLKLNPNVLNYINYVANIVHKLDGYIHVFKQDIPAMYRMTKDLNDGNTERNISVYMMANSDDILRAMCVQFSTEAKSLVDRKILEVHQTLSKSFQQGIMEESIPISNDLIRYFSDYLQGLNPDELSYGTYGHSKYDGSDIYDLNGYLLEAEKKLDGMRFNNIIEYDYSKISEVLDFGYRETLNTFGKLRKLLDRSNSLYISLNIIHVYIDILIMLCYIVEYIYAKTSVD